MKCSFCICKPFSCYQQRRFDTSTYADASRIFASGLSRPLGSILLYGKLWINVHRTAWIIRILIMCRIGSVIEYKHAEPSWSSRSTSPPTASVASSSYPPMQSPYQLSPTRLNAQPNVNTDRRTQQTPPVSRKPIKHSNTININSPTARQYTSCPSSAPRGLLSPFTAGPTGNATRTVTQLTGMTIDALEVALAATEMCPPAKIVIGTVKAILTILDVGIFRHSCRVLVDDCPERER